MNENYVRPPDSSKRERLISHEGFIPYNESISEEDQIARLLIQSEMEYEMKLAIAESVREECRRKTKLDREKHFSGIKRKFQQFQNIDKDNQPFYKQVLTYILAYENGDTIRIEVPLEFYQKLRATLHDIRVPAEELRRILSFIVIE